MITQFYSIIQFVTVTHRLCFFSHPKMNQVYHSLMESDFGLSVRAKVEPMEKK